jgi:hypothetical protein
LKNAKIESFRDELFSLFASISFTDYVKNNIGEYEGYYASVVYAFLCSIGFNIVPEDHTNKGRIDMTVLAPDYIYILEFKVDKSDEVALHQIKTKKYFDKYLSDRRKIYLIGIHFDSVREKYCRF